MPVLQHRGSGRVGVRLVGVVNLNKIPKGKKYCNFCNVVTALRIFCTMYVTVASAECSFSKLAHIKNLQRTTMLQRRLTDLRSLSIESDLAREVKFKTVIKMFSSQKARSFFKVTA